MSKIFGLAAVGGSVESRAQAILEELRSVFPYDAGMISAFDPITAERRSVVIDGYPGPMESYLNSSEWYDEAVEPFSLPRTGYPVRGSDLPIDPATLRGVAEYGYPAGLSEGLLSALITPEGRYVGFLMLSWAEASPPSDEACAVIGCVSSALTAMVDPMQSARALASILADDCDSACLLGDGRTIPLRGVPVEELLEPVDAVRHVVEPVLSGGTVTMSFVWPRNDGGWYGCRAFRSGKGLAVLTVRRLEEVCDLTRRELEVLASLVDGLGNAEIAGRLSVTTRTVRAHVEHILEKLEVPTRSAAVARAVKEGLVLPSRELPPEAPQPLTPPLAA